MREPSIGSSPRARGAVIAALFLTHPVGIIPARAGSRPKSCGDYPSLRDHPRARGEQLIILMISAPILGSSPRARGAAGEFFWGVFSNGIIPARAGSSLRDSSLPHSREDHPRARGEQCAEKGVRGFQLGSSPRARGAALVYPNGEYCRWIIPARAGSSRAASQAWLFGRDHPRARGEQLSRPMSLRRGRGSSPRARGAVFATKPG